MSISPESFFNCLLTQVGALEAVMKLNGVKANHLKPHGQVRSLFLTLRRLLTRSQGVYHVLQGYRACARFSARCEALRRTSSWSQRFCPRGGVQRARCGTYSRCVLRSLAPPLAHHLNLRMVLRPSICRRFSLSCV